MVAIGRWYSTTCEESLVLSLVIEVDISSRYSGSLMERGDGLLVGRAGCHCDRSSWYGKLQVDVGLNEKLTARQNYRELQLTRARENLIK